MFPFINTNPLQKISQNLRHDLLDMVYKNGGHIGGSLSSIDLITTVYFGNLFNLKKDHFILSAGHLAPALYTVLANAGYFDKKLLDTYSNFTSILQGHISTEVPGVNYSSGALGQGLSFSCGLALGDPKHTTICLTSDGEHQEGQIWESLLFAKKYKLGNLINIVDFNQFQIDGSVSEIMPLDNLAAKYIQFGWTVTTVDGHNFNQIISALKKAVETRHGAYPVCIIAKTTVGKGISFMENNFKYHDVKKLSESLYNQAKSEL
ncbi:MAG: transketolase [Candidatus Shapirobacteria bacterium]|jgi:transketolase